MERHNPILVQHQHRPYIQLCKQLSWTEKNLLFLMHLLQGKRHGARLQASVKKIKEKNPSDLVRLHQINQQSVNHWKLKSIISRLISFNSHDLTYNSSKCQDSLGRYSCKQQKWNHWRPFLMWLQCLIGPQDEIIQFGKLLKDRQVSFQTLAVNG